MMNMTGDKKIPMGIDLLIHQLIVASVHLMVIPIVILLVIPLIISMVVDPLIVLTIYTSIVASSYFMEVSIFKANMDLWAHGHNISTQPYSTTS